MKFLNKHLSQKALRKGFDEPCWSWYYIPAKDTQYCYSECKSPMRNLYVRFQAWFKKQKLEYITLPTHQQVVDWLREEKGIVVWVTMEMGAEITYNWVVTGEHYNTNYKAYYSDYYQALNAAINNALNRLPDVKIEFP